MRLIPTTSLPSWIVTQQCSPVCYWGQLFPGDPQSKIKMKFSSFTLEELSRRMSASLEFWIHFFVDIPATAIWVALIIPSMNFCTSAAVPLPPVSHLYHYHSDISETCIWSHHSPILNHSNALHSLEGKAQIESYSPKDPFSTIWPQLWFVR